MPIEPRIVAKSSSPNSGAADASDSLEARDGVETPSAIPEAAETVRSGARSGTGSKRPSNNSLEVRAGISPAVISDVFEKPRLNGYLPTPRQVQVKAAFWLICREDPLINPNRMSIDQMVDLVGVAELKTWWNDSKLFRGWFLNKAEHHQRAEYLYDRWLTVVEDRLPYMENKELTSLGKILHEIVKVTSDKGRGELGLDQRFAGMSVSQIKEFLRASADQLGWKLEIPEGEAAAIPPKETGPDER